MVMKHGSQFDSYFEHITYPLTLYSGACSASSCSAEGKYLAHSPALAKVMTECNYYLQNAAEKRKNHFNLAGPVLERIPGATSIKLGFNFINLPELSSIMPKILFFDTASKIFRLSLQREENRSLRKILNCFTSCAILSALQKPNGAIALSSCIFCCVFRSMPLGPTR